MRVDCRAGSRFNVSKNKSNQGMHAELNPNGLFPCNGYASPIGFLATPINFGTDAPMCILSRLASLACAVRLNVLQRSAPLRIACPFAKISESVSAVRFFLFVPPS